MDLQDKIDARRKAINAVVSQAAPAVLLDGVDDLIVGAAIEYTERDLRLKAAALVQEWLETEDADLDEGENLADRLLALMVGVADENKDGELSEDEQSVLDVVAENAWDYMAEKGVTDEDIDLVLNEGDAEAAARVAELLKGTIGDGEAADVDLNAFAFAIDEELNLDAVYKKRVVIRKGKKVRINKRVSGRVHLTAKQKMAIRKAGRRSHTAGAMMRRAKSNRVRARSIRK